MAKESKSETSAAFPPGIPQPALRALASAGYTRLEQLSRAREEDLLALHGFGPKALRLLREALEAGGGSFAGSAPGGQRTRPA